MCIIIQRPANVSLDYNSFETAVINNPDGWGYSASIGNNELITQRSPNKADPEVLYRFIEEEFEDVPIMLHLRYTTAGATSLRNAHPFPILEYETDGVDLRMAHNGTLNKYKNNTDESDTRRFVRQFVRPLFKRLRKGMDVENILSDPFVYKLLEDKLSTLSVISFIDGNGNTLNVNPFGNGGFYDENEVYFSNKYSFEKDYRIDTDYTWWGYNRGSSPASTTQQSNVVYPQKNVPEAPALENKTEEKVYGVKVQPILEHAKDTETPLFSEEHEVYNIEYLLEVSDEFIDDLFDTDPASAKMLLKEALKNWKELKTKVTQ